MTQIAERHKVSASLVFFLVHSTQFGIGVLGFQRYVVKEAGNDAWISVIIMGVIVHLYIWMIYQILQRSSGSLMTLHLDLFGKWIGNGLNVVWIAFFIVNSFFVLKTYIEIIKVWMFPDLNIWIFSAIIIVLLYYILTGGFRVVTGFNFFGVVLPIYIFLLFLIFPVQFADFHHLLPLFNHSPREIFNGVKEMALPIIGFETIFLFYPFVKNVHKSQKWAHIANAFTFVSYVIIMVISIAYYTEKGILKQQWATLAMWKIVELPLVERFEYIGTASWFIVILPNICLYSWCAERGLTENFGIKEKRAILFILSAIFLAVGFELDKKLLMLINTTINYTAFALIFAYIPCLYIITYIRYRLKMKRRT